MSKLVPLFRSSANYWKPKLVPRLARFTWSDAVLYMETFSVGLMVYIHFIDIT